MTHKRLTKKMKEARRRINGDAVAAIYDRAVQGGSDAYITVHQEAEEERSLKVVLAANARDERRLARRLKEWTGGLLAPDAFCLTTPDGNCISTDPRCMHQPKKEAV